MEDLDNNMDELFRKAGVGYPLKTDATGWDKIALFLSETPALPFIPNKRNSLKKYSGFIIILMAFFLFGTLTSRYIWKRDIVIAGKIKNPVLPVYDAGIKSLQTIATARQSLATQPNPIVKRQPLNVSQGVTTTFIMPEPNRILSTAASEDSDAESYAAEMKTRQQYPQLKSIANPSAERPDWQNAEVQQKNNDTLFNEATVPSLKADIINIHAATEGNPINKKTKNGKTNKPTGKFYIGALAGISLNRVKTQGLQKPGYEVGFKAGYQFTNQLSIETGLLFEKKYYYTSGEYFNTSRIASTMPVGMKVVSLKGRFSVFELPLTFKYNLPNNRTTRGHFYTTAGISTYLISREYNQYKTLLNGTQNNMTGIYNNQSTYSAASLNISIGYEKNIGKLTRLRFDPYIQFPIKGLGVGAIPVTTAGIHLGVFRFTH
jgi:Outer membrane protein beta-barrel domain